MTLLATKGEMILHANDLALLWGILDRNTLRVTLKRYVDHQLLYRIHRGLYSLVPVAEMDPFLLGRKILHRFCYVSMETVLSQEGIIFQIVEPLTFISGKSKQFLVEGHRYISRQLTDRFLFNPAGIAMRGSILWASAERAVADMLYFNPRYYFDRPIDWSKVKAMQKQVGYPLTPERYDSA